LRSTNRDVADAADKVADYLTGDPEVYANPEYILTKLSKLTYRTSGFKHLSPSRIWLPISKMKETAIKNNWPLKIEVALIGSCTNSSMKILPVQLNS
jgi:aconitate hydratase